MATWPFKGTNGHMVLAVAIAITLQHMTNVNANGHAPKKRSKEQMASWPFRGADGHMVLTLVTSWHDKNERQSPCARLTKRQGQMAKRPFQESRRSHGTGPGHTNHLVANNNCRRPWARTRLTLRGTVGLMALRGGRRSHGPGHGHNLA